MTFEDWDGMGPTPERDPSAGLKFDAKGADTYKAPEGSSEETMPKEYVDAVARVVNLATGGIGLLDADRFVASGLFKLVIGETKVQKFKSEVVELDEVSFFMIRDNASGVQHQMDHILLKRPKFICVNDNMNHSHPENPQVIEVMHEFFKTYFPWRSSFELPEGRLNQYQYIDDMIAAKRVRRKKAGTFTATVVFFLGLTVFCMFLCLNTVCVQRLPRRGLSREACV